MMTTQRLEGGHQWIELLLVIMILAMLAMIVTSSLDIAPNTTECVDADSAPPISSSSALDVPITSRDDLAARRDSFANFGTNCRD